MLFQTMVGLIAFSLFLKIKRIMKFGGKSCCPNVLQNVKPETSRAGQAKGCQIFLGKTYQSGRKYTK
jgi:hypothetical protein